MLAPKTLPSASDPNSLMLCLDLDGTLIEDWDTPGQGTVQALQTAQNNGMQIVLATGRTRVETFSAGKNLGFTQCWTVCGNGAWVGKMDFTDATGGPQGVVTIAHHTFSPYPILRELMRTYPDLIFGVDTPERGYLLNHPFSNQFSSDSHIPTQLVTLEQISDERTSKVLLFTNPDLYDQITHWLEDKGLEVNRFLLGEHEMLAVNPQGVSKAAGLEALRQHLGVAVSDTVAVGDGKSDISMLRWAGCGVALGSAPAIAQQAADILVLDYPLGLPYLVDLLLDNQ